MTLSFSLAFTVADNNRPRYFLRGCLNFEYWIYFTFPRHDNTPKQVSLFNVLLGGSISLLWMGFQRLPSSECCAAGVRRRAA